MNQVFTRSLDLSTYAEAEDRGELALIAETLSVLDQWIRAMPSQAKYSDLARQLRLAEIEVRRLLDDDELTGH